METLLRCPHCERTWDAAALDQAGRPATLILDDHVHRFCPGHPPTVRRVRQRATVPSLR